MEISLMEKLHFWEVQKIIFEIWYEKDCQPHQPTYKLKMVDPSSAYLSLLTHISGALRD